MYGNFTKKIPALECPLYVKDWISKWSGIECYDISLEQIAKIKPKTFLTNEDFIIKNMEKVFQVMEQNGIKEMVIHALHVYKFTNELLDRLDRLAKDKKVQFVCMSHNFKKFKNLITHSHDMVEHVISHDFNYTLSQSLQNKRNPHLDFIFLVNTKNQFRTSIANALKQSGVLKNSFVRDGGKKQFDRFGEKQSQLLELLDKQLTGNLCLDALRSWSGLPNLQAYEQAFCEIVIESANGGLDNTYNTNFSDLSEKTYRPISLGVPFVFLGSKAMFDKLRDDGYHIFDDGNFYNRWQGSSNLKIAISHLIDFLKKIVVDENLKDRLKKMAVHNYKNFWIDRKLHHPKHNQNILQECFGETTFDRIYDLLKTYDKS